MINRWPLARFVEMPLPACTDAIFSRPAACAAWAACILVFVALLAAVTPHLSGDTADYLAIASGLCGRGSFPAYWSLRSWGYPAFQCLASVKLAYFPGIPVSQVVLFLVALSLTCWTFVPGRYATLTVAAAALPQYAYLQDILFPDGLTVSLLLLYLVALARSRFVAAVFILFALIAVKILFAILAAHLLFVAALDRGLVIRHGRLVALASLAGAVAILVAFPVVFSDAAYTAVFMRQRPVDASILPASEIKFECGGTSRSIAPEALDFSSANEMWAYAPSGPLSASDATRYGCARGEIKSLEREVIALSFQHRPFVHMAAYVEYFVLPLIGYPTFLHSYGMLVEKARRLVEPAGGRYVDSEKVTIEQFQQQGITLDRDLPFLPLAKFGIEMLIRAIALLLLAVSVFSLHSRGKIGLLVYDRGTAILWSFAVVYATGLMVAAPALSDRYTLINLLVLCLVATRVALLQRGATQESQ
jgi:hypothetical protein